MEKMRTRKKTTAADSRDSEGGLQGECYVQLKMHQLQYDARHQPTSQLPTCDELHDDASLASLLCRCSDDLRCGTVSGVGMVSPGIDQPHKFAYLLSC